MEARICGAQILNSPQHIQPALLCTFLLHRKFDSAPDIKLRAKKAYIHWERNYLSISTLVNLKRGHVSVQPPFWPVGCNHGHHTHLYSINFACGCRPRLITHQSEEWLKENIASSISSPQKPCRSISNFHRTSKNKKQKNTILCSKTINRLVPVLNWMHFSFSRSEKLKGSFALKLTKDDTLGYDSPHCKYGQIPRNP